MVKKRLRFRATNKNSLSKTQAAPAKLNVKQTNYFFVNLL